MVLHGNNLIYTKSLFTRAKGPNTCLTNSRQGKGAQHVLGGPGPLNAPCYRSWYRHTLVNDGYDKGKGAEYVLYKVYT